jgi:hydrogenase maturation protease
MNSTYRNSDMEERNMKILILGMGNPILSDDGVGLLMAERLKERVTGADVAVNPMVGLTLLDQILDYDRVFIIDAMTSSGGTIGDVMVISETGVHGSLHLFSSHGINIFGLMDFGRECGYGMPELAAVYGIEIGNEVAFGNELTPALQSRIDSIEQGIIADMVCREPSLSIATGISSPAATSPRP